MSYFRTQAAVYARYRPDYPKEVFENVVALCPAKALAWDCATGNGQAAYSLASYFERVIATDISAEQLVHARLAPNIEYRVADAANSGLASGSADLVSIFQAIHWMDLNSFYAEVNRVLCDSGIFVATNYADPVIAGNAECDQVLQHYNKVTVGSYWPAARAVVERLFELPFPFEEISIPRFQLARDWNLAELAGYLRSWSSTTRYVAQHRTDPVITFETEMANRWSNPAERRRIEWPFLVRVGRKIS